METSGRTFFPWKISIFVLLSNSLWMSSTAAPIELEDQRALYGAGSSAAKIYELFTTSDLSIIHKITSFIFLSQLFKDDTFQVYPGHWKLFCFIFSPNDLKRFISMWGDKPVNSDSYVEIIYRFRFYWKYQMSFFSPNDWKINSSKPKHSFVYLFIYLFIDLFWKIFRSIALFLFYLSFLW